MGFEKIITWIDWITIIFSFFAMFFAFKNWWNSKKELEKISICFNNKELNLDITRKDFTRQELQGILGILRVDMTKNYDIQFLKKIEYLDLIYQIQIGNKSSLNIEITESELKQFRNEIYKNNN